MTIRWRLVATGAQLAGLAIGTQIATGQPWSSATWYIAGVLAAIVNRQLLEPWVSTPSDVVANSLFGLALYLTTDKSINPVGWNAIALILATTLLISLTALVLGAGRRPGSPGTRVARAASLLSRRATANFIYSLLFVVSLTDEFSPSEDPFWVLSFTWVIVLIIGTVNWRDTWIAASGAPTETQVEGLLGPSRLLVSGSGLPTAGSEVVLHHGRYDAKGIVVTRILRPGSDWAAVHLDDPSVAGRFLGARTFDLSVSNEGHSETLGSVEKGSTHERLTFTTSESLEIGMTVAVAGQEPKTSPVLYQLTDAEVLESTVTGGSHLVVKVTAHQIGRFDPDSSRLTLHRWVPSPGNPVRRFQKTDQDFAKPDNAIMVGHVLGTDVPVFLDLDELCEGHLAILGMTKMGKTSLALRIARALAEDRRVVVVDQTGEYSGRRGLPEYDKEAPATATGLSVLNLPDGWVGADFALKFVEKNSDAAAVEYATGSPHPRSIIFDEAHQFIPEPSGLGFNAPGRDSAYQLGYHFMQVRKYGMSLGLISQRTAVVAKGALSQCENLVVFRSVDRTGLEYLEQIAGGRVSRLLPTLRQGEALLVGPAVLSDAPVVVKVHDQAHHEQVDLEPVGIDDVPPSP